jgi:tetratricopeptide (TPR) repeat protein
MMLWLVSAGLWLTWTASLAHAQQQLQPTSDDAMQAHYDAGERLLSTGDREQAALQFRLFLTDALHRIAEDRSRIGEYATAVPLFERALRLAPNDTALRLDYAEAALAVRDYAKAKTLMETQLEACPNSSMKSLCAKAHLTLGRALFGMADYVPAKDEFEAAVALDPTFETGYELGKAYLPLSKEQQTARIFAEMLSSFGDSATIHLDFGQAYGEADFPEQAISEFKAAMEKDDALPEVHYCLGAAYLMRSGESGFAVAETQFRKELALHPDDSFSYSQLGYIAMSRHDLAAAEIDLSRASKLAPRNPDNFLLLGEIYTQLERPSDAEAALRQAIAVSSDPSRNHYQIRGAHYQLGRLLLQGGDLEEGKKQLRIAEDLLIQNSLLDRVNLAGKPIAGFQFPKVANLPANPEAQAAVHDFERRVAPAIADSYNNLGALSAADKNYLGAVDDFEQAATWNPAMDGLDFNWGKAAFAAKQYSQAALCFGRYLQAHPGAVDVREPLGFSHFMLQDYGGAVNALAPIADRLQATPLLAYAYAESLLQSGNYDSGMARLQQLESSNPSLAVIHLAIGKAFLSHTEYAKAEPEVRAALTLKPEDSEAKFVLARILLALQRVQEAQALLSDLIARGSNNPDVYLQMSRIQMEHGGLTSAISTLEAACKSNPNNISIHQELASAYRQASRSDDSSHEMKLVEALQSQSFSSGKKVDEK